MTKIKLYVSKHPILFGLGIAVLFSLIIVFPVKNIFMAISGQNELTLKTKYILGFIQRLFGLLVCIFLLFKLGYSKVLKFGTGSSIKMMAVIWPALILIFFNLPYDLMFEGKYTPDIALLLPLLLRVTGVGLIEEFFFRGLILSIFLSVWAVGKTGIYKSVIFSSILFGIVHLINLLNILKGQDILVETISQIFYAFFLGIFFAAVYLRTQNIWISVIIHTLFNLADDLSDITLKVTQTTAIAGTVVPTSISDAVLNAALALPYALFGLYILRKVVIESDQSERYEHLSIK